MTQPEVSDINAVLTFVDGEGVKWMAGAIVGPLIKEGGFGTEHKSPQEFLDRVIMLESFRFIYHPPAGSNGYHR